MNRPTHKSSYLYDHFSKLDKYQLKVFYGMLVHYWAKENAFISKQNFFNLWCELNELCHNASEAFPDPYDEHNLVKSYCHEHPYYFIDILELEPIIKHFCVYLDNKLSILASALQRLATEGIRAACECVNEALCLNENIDELVAEIEEHIKVFSH